MAKKRTVEFTSSLQILERDMRLQGNSEDKSFNLTLEDTGRARSSGDWSYLSESAKHDLLTEISSYLYVDYPNLPPPANNSTFSDLAEAFDSLRSEVKDFAALSHLSYLTHELDELLNLDYGSTNHLVPESNGRKKKVRRGGVARCWGRGKKSMSRENEEEETQAARLNL